MICVGFQSDNIYDDIEEMWDVNVGDTIVCKKKRNDDLTTIKKHGHYVVSEIRNHKPMWSEIYIIGENGKEMAFKLDEYSVNYINFSDYFYSKKELLSMKLKKINNN